MARSASVSVPDPARAATLTSVREVRLVASARPSQAWTAGERVTWSGRVYRVEATQDPSGPGADADDATGYVHLSPLPAAGP
jgi:hypothetical protein